MTAVDLRVDFERLKNDIETLSKIGRSEDLGIYRMAFTDGDMQARKWLKSRIDDAGLTYYQDGAANIHGRLNWTDELPLSLIHISEPTRHDSGSRIPSSA